MTQDDVLDEVAYLATVEHALCVDYLLIQYALGAGLEEVTGTGPEADLLSSASGAANQLAIGCMRHLRRANRVLTAAGRQPSVGRAGHVVPETGAPIAIGTLTAEQFVGFPKRVHAIAAAVDRRTARLRMVVADPATVLEPGVRAGVESFTASAADHRTPLDGIVAPLTGMAPFHFLKVTRTEPSDEFERRVLALSNEYYQAIAAAVCATFGHEDELMGLLDGRVVQTMLTLEEFNQRLALRRLLPSFTLPPGG